MADSAVPDHPPVMPERGFADHLTTGNLKVGKDGPKGQVRSLATGVDLTTQHNYGYLCDCGWWCTAAWWQLAVEAFKNHRVHKGGRLCPSVSSFHQTGGDA